MVSCSKIQSVVFPEPPFFWTSAICISAYYPIRVLAPHGLQSFLRKCKLFFIFASGAHIDEDAKPGAGVIRESERPLERGGEFKTAAWQETGFSSAATG